MSDPAPVNDPGWTNAAAQAPRWWLWPALGAAAIIAFAVAYLLVPSVNVLARTASSVLGSEDPLAVRIFLVTHGGRSPLAAVALIIWQALAAPVPGEAAFQASGMMWGPLVGSLVNWTGLVAGASLMFLVGRALVGGPIAHFYPRRSEPLGIARWVLLGLRLIPFIPQDFLSLAVGASRVGFVDFFVPTAVAAAPTAVVYAAYGEQIPTGAVSALVWISTAAGGALLAFLARRYRESIPWGNVSAERKRTLAVGAAVAAAGIAAYAFVPAFKSAIDNAAAKIASGDIAAVRDYLLSFGVWAPVVSALLMILQSVVAPLPAFVITFTNGLLFGWVFGALLSWSSAMAGAAICFFISRSLGRPVVEKLVGGSHALEISDRFFDRFGDRAVLIARLLPFVSFDLISYGAGLTSMRFWPFFIATGIGQLPATLVYSYLGQNLAGSVRIVFLTFLITIAIFVAIAAGRPAFQRWMDRGGSGADDPAGAHTEAR